MLGIFYFSSTGNSLWIAKKTQERFGGKIVYIPHYHGNGNEFDRIILVTPIYSFGMPTCVYDRLPVLDRTKEIIIIQNYGGMVGGADRLIYLYAKKFELDIRSVYTIKMPENFTLTFTVPNFYLKRALERSHGRLKKILDAIESGDFRLPRKKRTKEKTYLKNKSNWHIIGERFSVNADCIACGKCVSVCPVGNISLKDGKIAFGNDCVACLGCYHRCPQKAIVYLNKKKISRYINPNIDENEIGKDL